MHPEESVTDFAAAQHALQARAAVQALREAVVAGAGTDPIEATILLTNVGALGRILPEMLGLISERLEAYQSPDSVEDSDVDGNERAFRLQVALDYLKQTRESVEEAEASLRKAVQAISAINPPA